MQRRRTRILGAAPFFFAVLIGLSNASAATLEVGAGKKYALPSAAIAAAAAGDHVLIAPGTYFDCAQVYLSNVTIEGAGDGSKVVLTDKTCGGKAILVIDGDDVTVSNLTLTRARVPDGNGAGIRAEGGNLTVDGVHFINNQDGILSSNNPQATITVRNSEFVKNGTCNGACAHGIYVGQIAALHVQHSVFRQTKEGHHIKSRAAVTEVVDCDLSDGTDGTASYAVEAPNGGTLIVRNSRIQKGPQAGNHNTIAIGTEGVTQVTPEITIENNEFHNDGNYRAVFVFNLTATEARVHGNSLHGATTPLSGDGTVD